jgi:putative transposase
LVNGIAAGAVLRPMPRRSRIMLNGIPVHVIQRGNNRQGCFYEEQDRSFYLFHLNRLLSKTVCALHAYCLMTNHVHLLLTASSVGGCGHLMKNLGQLHTQYMNRTYGRSGSLWEGRFRSCLVQSEEYVLACYRYIELNPVRGGLALTPVLYPWSSCRANAEDGRSGMLTPHDEYRRLGNTDVERRRAYRELLHAGLDPRRIDEIRVATNGNFALGNKPFRQRISAALGRRAERGAAGRPRSAEPDIAQLDLLGVPKKNVVCP